MGRCEEEAAVCGCGSVVVLESAGALRSVGASLSVVTSAGTLSTIVGVLVDKLTMPRVWLELWVSSSRVWLVHSEA